MRLTVKAILLCVVALAAPSVRAAVDDVSCPMVRIVPERLPDMNIPRSGQDKIVETDGKVGAYRIRPSAAVWAYAIRPYVPVRGHQLLFRPKPIWVHRVHQVRRIFVSPIA